MNSQQSPEYTGPVSGYTLIELCVVIALIGIISAIAVPAYSGYSITARQAAAMSRINQIALALERYNQTHYSYEADFDTLEIPDGDQWFEYSIRNADRFSFIIRAEPIAGNNMLVELNMDHIGRRQHRKAGHRQWSHGWPR